MSRRHARLIRELRSHASPAAVAGMARYGIRPRRPLGVSMPLLRGIGRRIGTDHALALELWDSGIHEARILATLLADPARMDEHTVARWVRDCDSWDIVDQCCGNIFAALPSAYGKCLEWSRSRRPYVKRAGFALMARLAVRDRESPDRRFLPFLSAVRREAHDERNFVKKAVQWALRQVGKRNRALHARALGVACQLAASRDRAARWVGTGALRELVSPPVLRRMETRPP